MTSDRKIEANRANARASTGPQTAHGRARAARNALRHALSIPVRSNSALSEDVEALTRKIVGLAASMEMHALARPIAEAQIDLCRIRRARQDLLRSAFSDPNYGSPPKHKSASVIRRETKVAAQIAELNHRLKLIPRMPLTAFAKRMNLTKALLEEATKDLITALTKSIQPPPQQPKEFAILSDLARKLGALDRYERRALSRRKHAIRAFDEARKWAH